MMTLGKMGAEDASKEVSRTKSDQDTDENKDRCGGKEEMVEPAARGQLPKTGGRNRSRCVVHMLMLMCVL